HRHLEFPAHLVVDDVEIAARAVDVPESRARAPLVRERVVLRQRPHGRARGKAVIELEGPDVGGEAPRRKVDVVAAEVAGGGEPVGHTHADATTEIDTVSVPEGLGRVVDVEGDAPGRVAPEGEVQVPEVVVTL